MALLARLWLWLRDTGFEILAERDEHQNQAAVHEEHAVGFELVGPGERRNPGAVGKLAQCIPSTSISMRAMRRYPGD